MATRALRTLKRTALATLTIAVAACASGSSMDMDDDQALIRVLNDSDEPTVTVSIESIGGNAVPLGVVAKGDAENLVFQLPEGDATYRLVAVGPEDEDRDDYLISRDFTVDGGVTVNWYLLDNELEVN